MDPNNEAKIWLQNIPADWDKAALPRYLDVVNALLDESIPINSRSARAVIEHLKERGQIQDPFPTAMATNQERAFTEFDARFGATAHYTLSVQRAVGFEEMITGIWIEFLGISALERPLIDRRLVDSLREHTQNFESPWILLEPNSTIGVEKAALRGGKCFLSPTRNSVYSCPELGESDGRGLLRERAESALFRTIGKFSGTSLTLQGDQKANTIPLKLKESVEEGIPIVQIVNCSSSPAYLFVLHF